MRLIVMLMGLCLAPAWPAERDYGFRVSHASLAREGEVLVLNAAIDYRFSPTLVEALRHGVPLVLSVDTCLRRPRRALWDETLWCRTLDFRLQYYPLARVYRVVDETHRFQRSFPRLDAALAALGRLEAIALPPPAPPRLPRQGYVTVQVRLNIERLPWALRPRAWFSPDWRLRSERYRWPLSG